MPILIIFLLIVGLFSSHTSANEIKPDPQQYKDCLTAAHKTPEKGFDAALLWQDNGGGTAARHCAAIALLELGQYKNGALRLEDIAQTARTSKNLKISLLSQAGQAWMLDENPARAESIFSSLIQLTTGSTGDNTEFYVERARSKAGQNNLTGALKDLNFVLTHTPGHLDALIFRGAAHRLLNNIKLASRDIVTALKISPRHPEGLLERGMLRRIQGDQIGARRDWMHIITYYPKTHTAETARTNIENMDVQASTKGVN